MAAAVLPRLTQLIVGGGVTAAGKRSAAEVAADRSAALQLVRDAFRCGCNTTLLPGMHCKAQQQAAVQYQSSVSCHSLRCYRTPQLPHCHAVCRRHPGIQDAVATLARHLCLRAPDKADNRAAAIKAAAELVVELPQWEQEQFVGFVFDLSKTKQVRHNDKLTYRTARGGLRSRPKGAAGLSSSPDYSTLALPALPLALPSCCCRQLGLRTLSVGLANNLLLNLPEPFKRSTFAAAAGSGSGSGQPPAPAQPGGEADAITATPAPTRAAQSKSKAPPVPAGMVVAPWSVVALATLLHRCARGDGHLRCMFPMQAQVQDIEQLEL